MRSTRAWFLVLASLVPAATGLACDAPPASVPEPRYPFVDPADPGADLFHDDNLPLFELWLSDDAQARLADDPRAYVEATFRYRDEVLHRVGVRLKGEYSFRDLDGKASFKIKFDEFESGQSFHGKTRLLLNNAIQDPSFLSESFGYLVARQAGVPAPRTGHALVAVNDRFYGLYVNVEAPDKRMLARWFADNDGNLYEEGGVDLVPGSADAFDLETNETANDRRDLEALIAAADRATPGTFMDDLAGILDVDRFLRFCAVEAVVGQVDGYAFKADGSNNFRLYNDPTTGLFSFIPSGMDRVLRPRFDPGLVHPWLPGPPVYVSPWAIHGRLLEKCVAGSACRAAYRRTLDDVVKFFEGLDVPARAAQRREVLRAAVAADPRMEMPADYFDQAVGTVIDYATGRPASLRAALQ